MGRIIFSYRIAYDMGNAAGIPMLILKDIDQIAMPCILQVNRSFGQNFEKKSENAHPSKKRTVLNERFEVVPPLQGLKVTYFLCS